MKKILNNEAGFYLTALEIEVGALASMFVGMLLGYVLTRNAIAGFFVGVAVFLYGIVILSRHENDSHTANKDR